MIYSKNFIFSPFEENTYVLYDDLNNAIIVDPGMQNREEEKEISEFIEKKGLKITRVLLTHAHHKG